MVYHYLLGSNLLFGAQLCRQTKQIKIQILQNHAIAIGKICFKKINEEVEISKNLEYENFTIS